MLSTKHCKGMSENVKFKDFKTSSEEFMHLFNKQFVVTGQIAFIQWTTFSVSGPGLSNKASDSEQVDLCF